jgi:PAS domain S-box-containing protein
MLETMADAIVACDPQGRVAYANAAVEALLGWPAAELIGRPLDAIVPPRLRDAHPRGYARYLSDEEPRAVGRPIRMPALRRDGTEVDVELTVSHLRDGSGGALLVGTIHGLSDGAALERKQTLTRYLQATARASARLAGRLDLTDILPTAVRTLVEDFDVARAALWLAEPEPPEPPRRLALGAEAGAARPDGAPRSLDLGDGQAAAEAFGSGRPVARDAGGAPGATLAAFPLLASGARLGALVLETPRPLDPEVLDAVAAFAAIVAAAINNVGILRREQAARLEAEDQKRKLQTILDTIPVGVLLAEGPDGRLTVANPSARAILGTDVASLPLADFLDEFHASRLDGAPYEAEARPLRVALHERRPVRETLRVRRPDGRDVVLDLNCVPFPGPAGGAVSTFADVTERLRLEAELAERAAQFKALLDHLPVGVAYFDRGGVCRASNGPARRILGRSRREISGRSADELFAARPELRDALLRCIRDRTPHTADGVPWMEETSRYLDWRFEPLPGPEPDGSRGALALIVDVTDQALARFALQRTAEAAESASRRKTQFLSAVSHDLRTPVNALSLQAELLARLIELRGEPEEELTQLSVDIRKVAANLIELINDLLDLARFDSGVVDFQPTDFSLDAFLEQTLAPLEATAAAKGLDFTWRVDRAGRVVRGDRVKLGRVLVNLVSNAVKFTEVGLVDVTARAAPDGGLVLAVRDTGPGIPEDQLERVFDEFAQLRNPERDRTKGTGLGLAICRRLVEGVGGRLTVESRVGVGSTFTARYPVDHMAADVNAPLARPAPRPGERATLSAPILLVEDDPDSRDTLARLLRHAGYAVQTAPDGRSALETLGQVRPALVLLDLMMPGMEGGEVLRRIRKSPDWQELKVVLLTGDVLSGRTADLMAMNVDGILAKPVDFNQLLDMVARFAAHRAAPA